MVKYQIGKAGAVPFFFDSAVIYHGSITNGRPGYENKVKRMIERTRQILHEARNAVPASIDTILTEEEKL